MSSELLTADEVAEVTGYKHVTSQRDCLDRNRWSYVLNGSGRPIVGRVYARMKLAGVNPSSQNMQTVWTPDFTGIENANQRQ